MYPCRLTTIFLFATVITGSNAYIQFVETGQNSKLTEKIAYVNETLYKAVKIPFLTKTVQAFASMDPTVHKLLTAISNGSLNTFRCLEKSVTTLSTSTIRNLTLSTLTPTIVETCPEYADYFYAVENATIAVKKRLDSYTPEVIAQLPLGVFQVLKMAAMISLNMLDKHVARNNMVFQNTAVDEMVKLINGLNDTDRKAFAKLVPWSAPFVKPHGKYSKSLRDTLDLVNTGLRQSFNHSELAPVLTKLTLGVASKLPAIVRWVYNKLDTLPISNKIYKDTAFTSAAEGLAVIINMYLEPELRSIIMKSIMQLLLGGQFLFINN